MNPTQYQLVVCQSFLEDSLPTNIVVLTIGPGIYSSDSCVETILQDVIATTNAPIYSRCDFCQGSVACQINLDGNIILQASDLRPLQLQYWQKYVNEQQLIRNKNTTRQNWEVIGTGAASAPDLYQYFKLSHFFGGIFPEYFVVKNKMTITITNNTDTAFDGYLFEDDVSGYNPLNSLTINFANQTFATTSVAISVPEKTISPILVNVQKITYRAYMKRYDSPPLLQSISGIFQQVFPAQTQVNYSAKYNNSIISVAIQYSANVNADIYDYVDDFPLSTLDLKIMFNGKNILSADTVQHAKQQIKLLKSPKSINNSLNLFFYVDNQQLKQGDTIQLSLSSALGTGFNVFIGEHYSVQ